MPGESEIGVALHRRFQRGQGLLIPSLLDERRPFQRDGKGLGREPALRIDGESPRAFTELGILLLIDKQDAKAAVEKFQQALRLDPLYGRAHEQLPFAYALLGETEKAFSHARLARKLLAGNGAKK